MAAPSPRQQPGASPPPQAVVQNRERIDAIDAELARTPPEMTSEEQSRLAELDARSHEQQALLTALQAEGRAKQAAQGENQRILEAEAAQESAARRERLAALRDAIRAQEREVVSRQQQLAGTLAMPESDVGIARQQDASRAREQLHDLKQEYAALQAAEVAGFESSIAKRRDQLAGTQAEEVNFALAAAGAQAELQRLSRERTQLREEIAQRVKRGQELQAERRKLEEENAQILRR